jgi:hypothetical protein
VGLVGWFANLADLTFEHLHGDSTTGGATITGNVCGIVRKELPANTITTLKVQFGPDGDNDQGIGVVESGHATEGPYEGRFQFLRRSENGWSVKGSATARFRHIKGTVDRNDSDYPQIQGMLVTMRVNTALGECTISSGSQSHTFSSLPKRLAPAVVVYDNNATLVEVTQTAA